MGQLGRVVVDQEVEGERNVGRKVLGARYVGAWVGVGFGTVGDEVLKLDELLLEVATSMLLCPTTTVGSGKV